MASAPGGHAGAEATAHAGRTACRQTSGWRENPPFRRRLRGPVVHAGLGHHKGHVWPLQGQVHDLRNGRWPDAAPDRVGLADLMSMSIASVGRSNRPVWSSSARVGCFHTTNPTAPPALTPARALARGQCAAGGGVHWHPAISVNSDEELGLQYLAGSILRLTRVRGGINDWYQGGYSDPARKAVDYPPEITVERQLLEVPKSRCRSKADIAPFSRMTSAMASSMPLMHRRASSSGMQNCRYPDRYRCTAA